MSGTRSARRRLASWLVGLVAALATMPLARADAGGAGRLALVTRNPVVGAAPASAPTHPTPPLLLAPPDAARDVHDRRWHLEPTSWIAIGAGAALAGLIFALSATAHPSTQVTIQVVH